MVEKIGCRPSGEIPPDHALVKLALRSLSAQGLEAHLNVGSTDANLPLSRGFPAICLGLTTGGGAHTLDEHIDTSPLSKGMAQLTTIVKGAFTVLPA